MFALIMILQLNQTHEKIFSHAFLLVFFFVCLHFIRLLIPRRQWVFITNGKCCNECKVQNPTVPTMISCSDTTDMLTAGIYRQKTIDSYIFAMSSGVVMVNR
jgi:hypothetical protein